MATNFPASLDTLTNPTSSDSLSSPSHSAQHANVNDAVEALQAKVGADSSAVTSSLDYKVAQLEAISHGKILQVVSTTKTDTFTTTAASFTDVTGLSVSITPSAASSKILVVCMIGASGVNSSSSAKIRLVRDSTAIAVGDSAGSRTRATQGSLHAGSNTPDSVAIVFLDSPNTTSATTYKIQGFNASALFFGVNRGETDADSGNSVRSASTITVMEVSA